jgi:hypothetical protein
MNQGSVTHHESITVLTSHVQFCKNARPMKHNKDIDKLAKISQSCVADQTENGGAGGS